MKKFTLIRYYHPEATIGALLNPDNGERIISTLEPPNRDNAKDDPKTYINESGCVPEGVYICQKRDPEVFKESKFKDNWEILGVPTKAGVVFHCGNYWFESKSCLLVGTLIMNMNPKNNPDFDPNRKWFASQSRDAMKKFIEVMPERFELEIVSTETLCNARNI